MRRKAQAAAPGNIGWIISFADLTTILLTFLVLIIGITAHDAGRPAVFREGVGEGDYVRRGDGVLMTADRSLLAPVIELVNNLDQLPEGLSLNQEEFKKAVFQLDPVKTPDFQRLTEAARTGVEFALDNGGLVIQWDRALLFPEGEATLLPGNIPLLEKLAVFLKTIKMPISLESHTNPLSGLEGGNGAAARELSMKRSKAVMEYLTGLGLAGERFRLGGFGGARPRTLDPELAWENSRLEIIIHRPEPSSWRG